MKTGWQSLAVVLSRTLGLITASCGIMLIVFANILWGPIAQGVSKFSEGLSTAHDAIEAVSNGVGSSSAIVSGVRISIVTTSQVVSETRSVLLEAGSVTDELREMSLLSIEDLETLGAGLSAVIGHNNFNEMADRMAIVYEISGQGMLELEQLAGTLELLESYLLEVADAIETLETDLFSAEAAFGEANQHLTSAVRSADSAVASRMILYIIDGLGIIVILAGLYLLVLGQVIRKTG
jgi:hypothetical protein